MKKETIAEFLQRGGKITKLPSQQNTETEVVKQTTAAGPAIIMTYDEADLFYGEKSKSIKAKKQRKSAGPMLDLDALPKDKKILDIVNRLRENYGKGIEESISQEDED